MIELELIGGALFEKTFRDHGCLFVEFETSKGVLVSSSVNLLIVMTMTTSITIKMAMAMAMAMAML